MVSQPPWIPDCVGHAPKCCVNVLFALIIALPFDPCLSILCSPGYKCEMEIEDRSEATLTPRCVCSDSDGKCADEEEVEKPCGDHTCKSFEDCIINRENLHVCCLMNCSSPAAIQQFHRPVPLCGSNKIIYSSLCLLDKIRCLTGKTVDVEPIIDDCISHGTRSNLQF